MTHTELVARVEQLEQESARFRTRIRTAGRATVATVLAAVVASFLFAQDASKLSEASSTTGTSLSVMRCRSLEIVDVAGRVTARIAQHADGTWLQFLDANGKERLRAGLTTDGVSRIRLGDETGIPRWSTSVTRRDVPSPFTGSTIYSSSGKPLMNSLAGQNDEIQLWLYAPTGVGRMSLGVMKGFAEQAFYDAEGKYRIVTNTTPDSAARMLMYGSDGKNRMQLISEPNKTAALVFKDVSERPRVASGVDGTGLAFHENIGINGRSMMYVRTALDGSFTNYVYRTPGEQAWQTASDLSTGLSILQLLLGSDEKR